MEVRPLTQTALSGTGNAAGDRNHGTEAMDMLHERCMGCVRRIGNECLAFAAPAAMWERGECWAYTEDVVRVERELRDVVDYAGRSGRGRSPYEIDWRRYRAHWGVEGRGAA